MSERLRDLLCEAEDGSVQNDSFDATPGSWPDEGGMMDTAAKLKDVLESLKQDKADGLLIIDDDALSLLRELNDLFSIEPRASFVGSNPRMRSVNFPHEPSGKTVLSARACVVCHRDDRPGEQRKSGFKCLECIGMPSKLERSDVSFAVLDKAGTKQVDVYGKKSIEEYDLGDNVGKGSYGKVKTCRHKKSGQIYAMKIVDKRKLEKMRKPGSLTTEFDKVMTEIEIMKSLHHPNVVKMYEVIDDPESGKVYLIMEFCGGGRIFDMDGDKGGLAANHPERLKKYVVAIANGLEYLHSRHIYHRDLKPDNILLDASDHAKLTDFGVSAVTGENDVLTQTEGTPAFNAPEEFYDDMQVAGDKADIWSFGATLYCMAFGYLPFMGADIREIGEAIKHQPESYPDNADPLLVDLLRRFLEKDPSKRISLKEVLNHRYVEDVRTVKGQAVETVTCRLKAIDSEDLGLSSNDPDFQNVDGVLVRFDHGHPRHAKGLRTLTDYVNTKGGVYQVVLPTPDSCTLFRPRSSRRTASVAPDREISTLSFCRNETRATNPAGYESPGNLSGGGYASSNNLNVPMTLSFRIPELREAYDDDHAETLLDQLGISLL
eukprot:TRINITY_DN2749_c0_g1_i2.p1 TRINITY_DN2749_c0_g1~~TRINITY_DN2749_c0_g1_i2.p1  ORF type:complete len:603 (-),score=214.41 TRINITY_DN2749_c0_g1_i2:534-2342(-)